MSSHLTSFDQLDPGTAFFEATVHLLAGLLSAHDLSGDRMFLERAQALGDALLPFFEPTRGAGGGRVGGQAPGKRRRDRLLPPSHCPPAPSRAPPAAQPISLADWGTNTVEFGALARVAAVPLYQQRAEEAMLGLHATFNDTQLLPKGVDRRRGNCYNSRITLGPGSDSYYEVRAPALAGRAAELAPELAQWLQATAALDASGARCAVGASGAGVAGVALDATRSPAPSPGTLPDSTCLNTGCWAARRCEGN